MAALYSIDDLPDEDWKKVEPAYKRLTSGDRSRDSQHELYEKLTNAGLSPEYADEFINMLMES